MDRSALIRKAASLPRGSKERREILSRLKAAVPNPSADVYSQVKMHLHNASQSVTKARNLVKDAVRAKILSSNDLRDMETLNGAVFDAHQKYLSRWLEAEQVKMAAGITPAVRAFLIREHAIAIRAPRKRERPDSIQAQMDLVKMGMGRFDGGAFNLNARGKDLARSLYEEEQAQM